jgi:uncharacterized caspase-like protein
MRQGTAQVIYVIACTLVLLQSAPAQAERRVALVIGNSAYVHAPALRNSANDARAIADLLQKAGFDQVKLKLDLAYDGMRLALRDFGLATRGAEVALVYFAGHGLEFNGENYLVPVDAGLKSDSSVAFETATLSAVLDAIRPAARLRLVILDACRSNPLAARMELAGGRTRSVPRGLGRIEPTGDVLVAYAAKAGTVAADGSGRHSPYAEALLSNLATPGLDIRLVLGRVRDLVLAKTNGAQEPFVYGSLGGATVALVAPRADTAAAAVDDADAKVARDYELAAKIGTKEAWDAFLAAHQSGFHADLARAQRAKLAAPAPSVALVTPSPAPPPPGAVEPLPADVPVAADVLRAIETGPTFTGAPPVSAAAYRYARLERHSDSLPETNFDLKVAVRSIRPGLLRLDQEIISKGGKSSARTILFSAANGLIDLSIKRTAPPLETRTLVRIVKMTGKVFPVEVGNQFSYVAAYRWNMPSPIASANTEITETKSCKVARKLNASAFHADLAGAAYLAECDARQSYGRTPEWLSFTYTEKLATVFIEALGLWLEVNPSSPKETLVRRATRTVKDLQGQERHNTTTTSVTLKAFTLAR